MNEKEQNNWEILKETIRSKYTPANFWVRAKVFLLGVPETECVRTWEDEKTILSLTYRTVIMNDREYFMGFGKR